MERGLQTGVCRREHRTFLSCALERRREPLTREKVGDQCVRVHRWERQQMKGPFIPL